MKKKLKFIACVFLIGLVGFISCNKERSCEECSDNNKPPLAAAGPDQTITLPTDSALLDGSKSSDPDGKISVWQWTKIAGPASFIITNNSAAKTTIKKLLAGVYQFEIKVTDDKGLSAKDTVQVMVDAPGNQPPAACAGSDQTISLPTNTVTLDGSCSADPDNNITSYAWMKIAGPSTFTIANANGVQTQVTGVVEGTYQFELKVTDASGLSSKDTIQIIVQPANSVVSCNVTNRPTVNAQLVPIGKLSKARSGMAIATAGSKVVFAGGVGTTECPECWGSPQVDIYDTVSKNWTTAKLSTGRFGIAAVTAGTKIFLAGGEFGDGANDTYYDNVDIYDAATNTWSIATLSEPRSDIGAAVVGSKVFFAGGEKNFFYDCSDRVDIYDLTTNSWSTATLSSPKAFLAAASTNNKIYFAGGSTENRGYTPSPNIDIYDNNTTTWSVSALQNVSGLIAGTSLANKIYWSIGCKLEIHDVSTGTTSLTNLSKPEEQWLQVYGKNVLVKDNKLIFLHDNSAEFDIYDTASDTWSIGVLPQTINSLSGVSANGTIYVTDGTQVWKLEF